LIVVGAWTVVINNNIRGIIALIASFSSMSINAADVSYSVGLLLAQYENVNRVRTPADSETSYTLIAAMTAIEEAADYSVFIDGNIRSIDYIGDIAPDRVTGDLTANLIWKINPGQFDWILDDTFTQTAINPLLNNSPGNRQNVNIFSTGPDYTIRFSATNNLTLSGRIENYLFENSNQQILASANSNRATLSASWSRQMNSRLNLSINDDASAVRYRDNQLFNNYDRNDVYLRMNYSSGLHTLDAQYGFTNVRNDLTDNIQYDRYLLAVSRASTINSSIRLSYQDIATDTGTQLAQSNSAGSTSGSVSTLASNDIFVDETLRAQYIKAEISGGVSLDIYSRDRTYRRQSIFDEESEGVILTGNWNLEQGHSIVYIASYINTLFVDSSINREDDDYIYSVSYNHRLRRNLSMSASVISSERESTTAQFTYDDLTFTLGLTYSSL